MIRLLFIIYSFTFVSGTVLKLNEETFEDTLLTSEYLMVKFFAPWCSHCKNMAPAYEKLSESVPASVVIAEVDGTENKVLTDKYDVKGFPTMKWFMNGTEYEFRGGREFNSMKAFVDSASGEWATIINTLDDLNDFLSSDEDAFVLTNDPEKDIRSLSTVLNNLNFGHVQGDGADLLSPNTLRIYSNYDNTLKYETWDESKGDAIRFIKKHSIPNVIRMGDEAHRTGLNRGFAYSKLHVLTFYDKDENDYDKLVAELEPAADKHSPDYIFVTIEKANEKVREMFSITEYPSTVLVDMRDGAMHQYHMHNTVSSDNIFDHVSKFGNGDLVKSSKSEAIPKIQLTDKPFKLVKDEFIEVIKNNNVFVKFYAPWCSHCKTLSPVWDELALKMIDSEVIVAKFDATANDIPGETIKGFPTLRYYKKGVETPIDYSGGRDLSSMVAFLEEQSTGTLDTRTEL